MARTRAELNKEDVGKVVPMVVDEGVNPPKEEMLPSCSATPKSESTTPPPQPSRSPSKGTTNGTTKPGPQLIGHLPRAEEEAMRVFEELEANRYQYSTLGRSREALESMTCDCQFVPDEDDPYIACGDGSDCINRLTQVECIDGDCRCRGFCQNQRMQRRQHAQIEVVQTEKKGFGLRAATDVDKDAFIYEYIGDVVSQPSLVKRMRDYAEEGIRHFYFMMLQKDEFIDATKRGGKGRFANHSCNPNCYVAKWTVGIHVRMGIFAKRKIQRDEELTFNYNVDRYGHEAQPCYCGEANCVGFLGGKTQTDVAAMDDLYLDALGIADEVEMYGLKGSKKKKGKRLDEDYIPVLKPLTENDVPKVIQAVRQTQSKKVLLKLLTRIKITEEQSALRQLMRLRGFSLMCNILEDFSDDVEVSTTVLEGISTWPLLQRNKIEDSKIEDHVRKLSLSDDERMKGLSEKLLAHWETLEIGYRIPKRIKDENEDDTLDIVFRDIAEESIQAKRKRLDEEEYERCARELRLARKMRNRAAALEELELARKMRDRATTPEEKPNIVLPASKQRVDFRPVEMKKAAQARDLIESVRSEAVKERKAAAEEEKRAAEAEKKAAEREKEKQRRKSTHQTEEEKEALKEKKLQKLVSPIVVKCMSKHRDQMSKEEFKQHAKELTQLISDKERKSQSYQSNKLDVLSDEKTAKIKKFANESIAKILRRMEKSKSSGLSTLASTSTGTPLSDLGSGAGTSGSPTLVELDALDIDATPKFEDEDEVKTNNRYHIDDRMSIDGDKRSATSTSAKSAPNSEKPRSRWDQPPTSSVTAHRSPAKDPRARRDRDKVSTLESR